MLELKKRMIRRKRLRRESMRKQMNQLSLQDEYNEKPLCNTEQDLSNYKHVSEKTTEDAIRPMSNRNNLDINLNHILSNEQNTAIRKKEFDYKNSIDDSESIESSNNGTNANPTNGVQETYSTREKHNEDPDGNKSLLSSENSVGEILTENNEKNKPGSRRAKLQDNDKNREILEEEFQEIDMMYCEHCDKSFAPPTFKRICQTYDDDGVLKCVKMYKNKRKVFSSAKVRKFTRHTLSFFHIYARLTNVEYDCILPYFFITNSMKNRFESQIIII